ncbi:BlaI/MecI/CopY family transcriptional regulator [Streptomyces sp. NPDC014940]|uniref:BlaI/MecI/CopY family transcriptional regulator n=1 Tax=Streptomyces sp. NPDC014940 TaxID=3364932 RepID=UPI0036F73B61
MDQLKAEETWLAQAQGSLPGAAVSSAPGAQPAAGAVEVPQEATAEQADIPAPAEEVTDAAQTVPQQRRDESVKEEQPKQSARRTAAVKKTAPAKKSTGKKGAEKTTATTTNKTAAEPAKNAAAKKTSAEPAKKATARKATPKKASAEPAKKATAKKTPAEKVPAQQAASAQAPGGRAAAGEKSGPPLWQLILDILRKAPGQPFVAREVHDQLAQDHPRRKTSAQTVRNNLQTLVQKGLAEKSRQQGNVMYTAYADTAAGAAPAADGEVEQAPEDAAEKVVAEV